MATMTFFGAAQEVTGSCYLLESEGLGKILMECGMHQGGDTVDRMQREKFDFNPKKIDAVVLSHAHLDHSGMLPRLINQGYDGPIYCTHATADLLRIMLKDSTNLYLRDLERENVKRRRRGDKLLRAEYDMNDVTQVLSQCVGLDYEEKQTLGSTGTLTFYDAGHILGSAIVQIDIKERDHPKRLVFSGDLGKRDAVLMNDPEALSHADLLVMESTYGDREHRTEMDTLKELEQILHETWQRGGNVMIPSFAVGRTQELLYYIGCLHQQGKLDNWQVFLDSPMAIEVTHVYDKWIELLDEKDTLNLDINHKAPLEAFLPNLFLAVTPEDSIAINKITKGALIIAGSGMCNGGRICHHFKQRIWNNRNTLIFVGFQARGTIGRSLVDGAKRIKLFGEPFVVKSRIETLGGFSAHAGQSGLVRWASRFKPTPRIVLVHGEPEAQEMLADKLYKDHQIRVEIPSKHDSLVF
ncbi:MBL fold metallo-hydrolase [Aliiglaciecola sp. CAU 1673]|uniref:MBL fold metallo-hydrolase RNA specificity domain-containing protein n=1 Tax=Aliiglaciecola sp. CAU 1673 TaxID=3032595 RepID=UPI0023DCE9B0|nr:MBL fold metallo-hydrolase [Aliiglaciecola sp. CAU 1673]MDF2180213.1 MBL fold metallo-hydrolase [Aliiglaciecola sp. CAU 1673]